eukprot:m.30075 g.30075  ORF g.30075 m.30075 type:complete len:182 (-) comp4743_c0_seq2:103-648(-)
MTVRLAALAPRLLFNLSLKRNLLLTPAVDYSAVNKDIFLGGSCGAESWRVPAITQLSAHNVTFFNPERADWHTGLIALETAAKQQCRVLLYVIDGKSRGVGSMVEVACFVGEGRPVVLFLEDIPPATAIAGAALTAREIKDLNRGRAYLADAARRQKARVASSLAEAVDQAVVLVQEVSSP